MKKTPSFSLFCIIFLLALMDAAAALAQTPTAKPAPPKAAAGAATLSEADVTAYNAAVTHFNQASNLYNEAKADPQKQADADKRVAANIAELKTVMQRPALKADPTKLARLHNLIGYLYLLQNDSASAIPELQETIRLSPSSLNARNNLGNALRQSGRYEEAVTQYRYILDHPSPDRTGPDPASVRFNLATVLGQAGRTEESLALYREITIGGSTDASVYKNYGYFLQKSGQSAEAADALRKSAELNPKDGSAWLGAGELYVKARRYDAAVTTLNRALSSDVDPPLDTASQYDAHFALAEAQAAQGNNAQAITEFDTAAGLQPQNAVPLYNKGVLQEGAGSKADAEAAYRAALARDPNNLQIQTALGLLLADTPAAAESATLLSQAAPRLPQSTSEDRARSAAIYAKLAEQYARQNDTASANKARLQAISLQPDNADARVAQADAYLAQKQYVSALTQYDAAARLRPQDAAIQNQRGVAYKNLKQYPKALAAFRKAAALNPRSAQIQNNLGVLYELLKQKPSAIAAYKKALTLDPNLTVARSNLARFAKSN